MHWSHRGTHPCSSFPSSRTPVALTRRPHTPSGENRRRLALHQSDRTQPKPNSFVLLLVLSPHEAAVPPPLSSSPRKLRADLSNPNPTPSPPPNLARSLQTAGSSVAPTDPRAESRFAGPDLADSPVLARLREDN